MKAILIVLLAGFHLVWAQAQDFTRSSESIFYNVGGKIDTADVDGDGDIDLFLSGHRRLVGPELMLYKNDGFGNFFRTSFGFPNLDNGSVDFADIDGDGDSDILLSGAVDRTNFVTYLYLNEGKEGFTRVPETPLVGVVNGEASFADIDGDEDLDLVISGEVYSPILGINVFSLNLYLNNGSGGFEIIKTTTFNELEDGSPVIADVDGDMDLDLLVVGSSTRLYLNDGTASFSLSNVRLSDARAGVAAFSDLDLDGDQDLILVDTWYFTTYLYWNNGAGIFLEAPKSPFINGVFGSISTGDVTGNSYPDVLITGLTADGDARTEAYLYINDGQGSFDVYGQNIFWGSWLSSSLMADIDGDKDLDVIISGELSPVQGEPAFNNTSLYLNNRLITSLRKEHINQLPYSIISDPYNKLLKISIESEYSGQMDVQIFDFQGRLMKEFQKGLVLGPQEITMMSVSLVPGNYLLRLSHQNLVGTKKFIIPR